MPRALFFSKMAPNHLMHSNNKPEQKIMNGQIVTKMGNDYSWRFFDSRLVLTDPVQIAAIKETPEFQHGAIYLVSEEEVSDEAAAPVVVEPLVKPEPKKVEGPKSKNEVIAYLVSECGAEADSLKGLKVVELAQHAAVKYNVIFVDWNT